MNIVPSTPKMLSVVTTVSFAARPVSVATAVCQFPPTQRLEHGREQASHFRENTAVGGNAVGEFVVKALQKPKNDACGEYYR